MDDLRPPHPPRNHESTQPIPHQPPLPRPKSSAVRAATTADLKFLDHLQKKFSNQLGFLPGQALNEYVARQTVHLATENDQPAGYILAGECLKYRPLMRPIIQAAVAMDAQRRSHGLTLLARIERQARECGQLALQANCREDLESNEFWKAAGFIFICALRPANARRQDLICWRKPLTSKIPLWFIDPPLRAGSRAQTPRLAEGRRWSTDATALPNRHPPTAD